MLTAIKPETVTAPVKFSVDTGKTPLESILSNPDPKLLHAIHESGSPPCKA